MHTGFSAFVHADTEAEAVAQATDLLEAERPAITYFEKPLMVEQGLDGEWEVALRVRVAAPARRRDVLTREQVIDFMRAGQIHSDPDSPAARAVAAMIYPA